jgi:SMODS-associated and fused to various effectors sensor domain
MSVSYIPEKVKLRLWGKAGGRCQYEGCNTPLWLDTLTQVEFNAAYIAHIIADSPDGPRGHPVLSEQLKADLSNLMLLCDVHHRLIDTENVAGHPVEHLRNMKALHEQRIEITTAIGPDKQSHILLYGANIGNQSSALSFNKAAEAMLPEHYPAELHPLILGMINSSFTDRDRMFWKIESSHLSEMIVQQVRPRLAHGSIHHLSIFALAPQPLLILLGSLLSDIPAADVFQLHREPPNWRWQENEPGFQFAVEEPKNAGGSPALVLSLSATVTQDRITAILGTDTAIWKVTIANPHNDFLKSPQQLEEFRVLLRSLLDKIKARHGQNTVLHVFPAMPVSAAVELGRIRMPKADMPWTVYDQINDRGGFIAALNIPEGDPPNDN